MKGFVISWFFPPINSSEGLVTFKLLKNSKFDYDVYTQSSNKTWSYDTNETKLVSDNIRNLSLNNKKVTYEQWVQKGVDYFDKNVDKYDFIMSRSMPPESHEIALKIKQKYPNKLWIASFGDPIANNPYNELFKEEAPHSLKGQQFEYIPIKRIISPVRILKNGLWKARKFKYNLKNNLQKIHSELQRQTILNADVLIFNNKFQYEHMLKDYDESIKSKGIIIPHTFDKDFYADNAKKSKDKITIRHLGHLDVARTPITFFKAIKRLKDKNSNLKDILNVELYGDVADKDKLYIINNELYDVVKIKKPVTYFESLKLMQESDLLLLVDANLSNVLDKNIFFAAKIADYIGSGTNIFGITMTDGPSADILKETNGIQCSYSPDEIYMKLRMIIDSKQIPKQRNAQNYDIKNVVQKYDKIVEEKIKG